MANSFDELMKNIKKEIKEVAKNEVSKEIKNTMKKHIQDDVYDQFEPTFYQRRYEKDGLLDEDNINVNVEDVTNGVNITATDITKANGDDDGELLTPLIEEGIYNWKHQPPPRRFIENTEQELKDGVIENTLKEGLKKRGLNIK